MIVTVFNTACPNVNESDDFVLMEQIPGWSHYCYLVIYVCLFLYLFLFHFERRGMVVVGSWGTVVYWGYRAVEYVAMSLSNHKVGLLNPLPLGSRFFLFATVPPPHLYD